MSVWFCVLLVLFQSSFGYNVIVYASTPSGIMSAISSARHFQGTNNVVLLAERNHVGGMMSGGLGKTDTGGPTGESLIGGLALEFFQTVGSRYHSSHPTWNFEPHVAEEVFLSMLKKYGVSIEFNVSISRVTLARKRIVQLFATDGRTFGWSNGSSVFIDASYEGDLFAKAGASYHVGREASSVYNEHLAGVRAYSPLNQFYVGVDPFDSQGNVIPLISSAPPGEPGQGDKRVESYNFRLCLTTNSSNKLPFVQPAGYDPKTYELFRRYAKALGPSVNVAHFLNIGRVPNGKTDVNNGGPVSTDCIGCADLYPEGSPAEREKIFEYHKSYTLGILYFLTHDPDIPASLRAEASKWGWCADEFRDNGGFPYQLYVREARRLIGGKVFTESNATRHVSLKERSIGCGSYNFDSHHVQRYACKAGSINCGSSAKHPCCHQAENKNENADAYYAIDEGDVQVNPGVFEIPYDVLLPKIEEVENLLVSVCVSSSHVGYLCLRLEPQYMIMGHSAGVAAALAFKIGGPVQNVDASQLYDVLKKEGQILSHYKAEYF